MNMRRWRLLGLAVLLAASAARGAELGSNGELTFSPDAVATFGFESGSELAGQGFQAVDWTGSGSAALLTTTPLAAADATALLSNEAIEGGHSLKVGPGGHIAFALRDPRVAQQLGKKLTVTMWGRAYGAEPVLELTFAHGTTNVGPGRMRVFAIRTGRESSDGWVEYSTGPVDGTVFTTPLAAIVLTAQVGTNDGLGTLHDPAFAPGQTAPVIDDPSSYGLIDAVEVLAGDAITAPAACTLATVDQVCGPDAECHFGHCIDAALMWGPTPTAVSDRQALVQRWAFTAQSLLSDRLASAGAAKVFTGAVAGLSAQTSPRGFFGGLQSLVAALRDSHTSLGAPASSGSVTYPIVNFASGPLDACFGLAQDDIGGSPSPVFAIFSVGAHPTIAEKLQPGDILTAIDGVAPSVWLATAAPRFVANLPNDASADPSRLATLLSKLIGHYASTITLSRCTVGGSCSALPDIPVGAETYAAVAANGAYSGSSSSCTTRFQQAVSTPPVDGASIDSVVTETVGGLTSVQFDGFEGAYDATQANPRIAWEQPWTTAFAQPGNVLVDARYGHGGLFVLGEWLFHLIRGTDQPYGMLALPRADWDSPDAAWLLSASWNGCSDTWLCDWGSENTTFTDVAAPAGAAAKIAWLDGDDVSMNDIVPRLLQGRSSFRVFGPHPSRGAFGEISDLPSILPMWGAGSLQVLDMRFGTDPTTAAAAPWQSGSGVVPDQIVMQTISDILNGRDTVLLAAKAWLGND